MNANVEVEVVSPTKEVRVFRSDAWDGYWELETLQSGGRIFWTVRLDGWVELEAFERRYDAGPSDVVVTHGGRRAHRVPLAVIAAAPALLAGLVARGLLSLPVSS